MSDEALYDRLERQLRALLEEERDFVANAGNFAALIRHELPDVNWAGFYIANPNEELVLGPFCGRPACTRIAPGRGVCGAAAKRRATLVVDDVRRVLRSHRMRRRVALGDRRPDPTRRRAVRRLRR